MRCGRWRRWYTLKGKYSLAFLARGGLHHTMGGRAYTRTLKHVHDTYTSYTDTDTCAVGSGSGSGSGTEAAEAAEAAAAAAR